MGMLRRSANCSVRAMCMAILVAFAVDAAADPSPDPGLSATKAVSGTFSPGGLINYTVVISNAGPENQMDNAGDEFVDVLPSSLALVSASATSGTAVATVGTNTVKWNGSIPAGNSVTLNIAATVSSNAAGGSTVTNQGTVSFDLDGNGSNESSGVTDDPATGTLNDGTEFTLTASAPELTVQLLATPKQVVYGQPIALTVTVSYLEVPPRGTVTFRDGVVSLGEAPLDDAGLATLTLPALSGGMHVLSAAFVGEGSTPPGEATVELEVSPHPSKTILSLGEASLFESRATLNVAVEADGPPDASGATGTVSIKNGTTVLGTAPVANGSATFTSDPLEIGQHSLTAEYSGDANFAPSVSDDIAKEVTDKVAVEGGGVSCASAGNPGPGWALWGAALLFCVARGFRRA